MTLAFATLHDGLTLERPRDVRFPVFERLTAAPLVGAVAVALVPRSRPQLGEGHRLCDRRSSCSAFGIAMWVAFQVGGARFQFRESYRWIPFWGARFTVQADGIALVMILLIAILVPVVILASWHDAEQSRRSVPAYFALLLALEFTMIGVFAAADVFLFYVFFEVMLVPMYFLIGSYGGGETGPPAVRGGEVLPLLAGRRSVHAGRGDRSVGGRPQPAGPPDVRLERADPPEDGDQHGALAVPRLLPGIRHQGAVLPVPHLAAGRRCRRSGRAGRAAGRCAGQGRHVRHPAVLPAAVPERVALLRAARVWCWLWSASSTAHCSRSARTT